MYITTRRVKICYATLEYTQCKKNRFGTVSGRPDVLYYLSESFGGTLNLMQNAPDQELQYSWEHLVIHEEENIYFEYFKYAMNELNLSYPSSWEEALTLYQSLVEANSTGVWDQGIFYGLLGRIRNMFKYLQHFAGNASSIIK